MSMDRCHFCCRQIDTDEDLDCYLTVPTLNNSQQTITSDVCICESCREQRSVVSDWERKLLADIDRSGYPGTPFWICITLLLVVLVSLAIICFNGVK